MGLRHVDGGPGRRQSGRGNFDLLLQLAVVQSGQQVFGAAPDCGDRRAGEARFEPAGDRPAQSAVADDDTPDTAADKPGLDAAAAGFDFG